MASIQDLIALAEYDRQTSQAANPLYGLAGGFGRGVESGVIESHQRRKAEEAANTTFSRLKQLFGDNNDYQNNYKIKTTVTELYQKFPQFADKIDLLRRRKVVGGGMTVKSQLDNPIPSSGGQQVPIKNSIDIGVPDDLKTVQEKKFEIEQRENMEKKELQSKTVKAKASDMLNTVDRLLSDKNIKQFGFTGPIPSIPGTGKREWLAELNYLKGNQVLQLMTELKQASRTGATGFGQLSEKELELLGNSANRLSRGLPEESAKRELQRIRGMLEKILNPTTQDSGGVEPDEGFSYLWE